MALDQHLRLSCGRQRLRKTGVIALPIHIPDDNRQLFLVVSRLGYSRKPWYLILDDARRWQIEMSLRFTKSEMAFESPRLIQGKPVSNSY